MPSPIPASRPLTTSFFLLLGAVLIIGVSAFVVLFPMLAIAVLGTALVGLRDEQAL